MRMLNEDGDGMAEERLIMTATKVVQYLEPLMSRELLHKFPDNSAYDFDYTQSAIWSPLVPRPYIPMDLDLDADMFTPTKLCFDEVGFELEGKTQTRGNKVGSKRRKNFSSAAFNFKLKFLRNQRKNKRMSSEFSPTPRRNKGTSCNPTIVEGWNNMLKIASKQFKRRKSRRDSIGHVKLSHSSSIGNYM